MKILLSSLMCLVLTAAQSFALKGGPDYTRLGPKRPATYSGAFFPIVADGESEPDNSVALFTVTLTSTGLGTGTAIIFREGNNYVGTMSATIDANAENFIGSIVTSFTKQTTTTSTQVIEGSGAPPPQEFSGDCTVEQDVSAFAGSTTTPPRTVVTTTARCNYAYTANGLTSDVHIIRGPSRSSQPATARLAGFAHIDYRSQDPDATPESIGSADYSVVGYRQ